MYKGKILSHCILAVVINWSQLGLSRSSADLCPVRKAQAQLKLGAVRDQQLKKCKPKEPYKSKFED